MIFFYCSEDEEIKEKCDPPIQKKGEYKVMGIKDSALKISGSVLKKMVEKEQQKKPGCMGFLHQPKRPAALKKTK